MKYICKNPECSKYNQEEYFSSETFKFVDGKLIGEHVQCPACGNIREEVNPNSDTPLSEKNVGIGKFSSMSVEQRKEALRQRSHEHFKKEVKERKDGLFNQAMGEMRSLHK